MDTKVAKKSAKPAAKTSVKKPGVPSVTYNFRDLIQKVFTENKNGGQKGFTKQKIMNLLITATPALIEKKFLLKSVKREMDKAQVENLLSNSGEGWKISNRYKLTQEARKMIADAAKPKKVKKPAAKKETKAAAAKKKSVKKQKDKKVTKPVKKAPKSPMKKAGKAKSRVDKGKSKKTVKQ